MNKCLALLILLTLTTFASAQAPADSIPVVDSLPPDSLPAPFIDTAWKKDSLPSRRRDTIAIPSLSDFSTLHFKYADHPLYQFQNPERLTVTIRKREGKEVLFYTLVTLILIFALLRNLFGRYIQDLFKIFFRSTVRQRQIREQLLQSPLPSLLMNLFYLLSAGMFLALVIQRFDWDGGYGFWQIYAYSMLGLATIYLGKFIVLKFVGWVLQAVEAADTYIFIVFTTNKILGILLLPLILLLAFSGGSFHQMMFTVALFLVAAVFAYRYFLSYVSVQRMIRVNLFHFILYLAAFEIVPLLLINKLLFRFLVETS